MSDEENLLEGRIDLGCWKDSEDSAIAGKTRLRSDRPIEDCYNFAKERKWSVFGIEAGDRCFTSPDAGATYQKHGESTDCEEGGKGGDWAMNVYRVTSSSIGKNTILYYIKYTIYQYDISPARTVHTAHALSKSVAPL